VLIEVLVAEVRLTKDLRYGLEWFFNDVGVDMIGGKNARMDIKHGASVASGLALDNVASPGLGIFWGTLDNKVNVLLNLLSAKTDFNILSTPTLLASDNKEASITVGGREPIALGPSFSTGSSVDVGGDNVVNNVVSSISYEETGLLLNVIPHINAGGLIRMELELTDRRTGDASIIGNNQSTPTFTERNIKTTLLAQNGSTVVIGGIILQQDNSVKNGIPGLENIPILSPLFSSKTKNRDRTELLIAITPHVVDHSKSGGSMEFIDEIRKLKQKIETK
jgi:general secretion pathway protein D